MIMDRFLALAFRYAMRANERIEERRKKELCTLGDASVFYPESRVGDDRFDGTIRHIRIGANTHIRGDIYCFGHGGEINIGDWCYLGPNSHIWSGSRITIGDRVLIGSEVLITDNDTHPLDAELRHKQFRDIVSIGQPDWVDLRDRPITIGDDVWIGTHCVILPGVTIGDRAIIGAGSIVCHDIPADVKVHGVV